MMSGLQKLAALYLPNPSCFIAIKEEKLSDLLAMMLLQRIFGPLGVSKDARGLGVGTTLVQMTLLAMLEAGMRMRSLVGLMLIPMNFIVMLAQKILLIPDSRKVYLRMVRKINR